MWGGTDGNVQESQGRAGSAHRPGPHLLVPDSLLSFARVLPADIFLLQVDVLVASVSLGVLT